MHRAPHLIPPYRLRFRRWWEVAQAERVAERVVLEVEVVAATVVLKDLVGEEAWAMAMMAAVVEAVEGKAVVGMGVEVMVEAVTDVVVKRAGAGEGRSRIYEGIAGLPRPM